ncbi:hypothetical protein PR048_028847 [Dryococelus australis]|uniref:Peptidase A2 domain-containing protein n=1 Tax=Dryococelus australis TaxID=614101 RepID=A0ABQ9GC46_9NEOP|nr:hypothetical protein PR048_028847 [Dryococelus australis]
MHLEKMSGQTTVKIIDFEKYVNFIIETGADVSCVPTSVVPEQMLQIVKKMEKPILGPDGCRLNSVPKMESVPLLNKLKAELDRPIQLDIIEPVTEPTEWVAPLWWFQKEMQSICAGIILS